MDKKELKDKFEKYFDSYKELNKLQNELNFYCDYCDIYLCQIENEYNLPPEDESTLKFLSRLFNVDIITSDRKDMYLDKEKSVYINGLRVCTCVRSEDKD